MAEDSGRPMVGGSEQAVFMGTQSIHLGIKKVVWRKIFLIMEEVIGEVISVV